VVINRILVVLGCFVITVFVNAGLILVHAEGEQQDAINNAALPLGYKNEPAGFHDITWGTDIDTLNHLRKVPTNEWLLKNNEYDQNEKSYIRKDARIVLKDEIHFLENIGDVEVRVEYVFYRDKFYKVILNPQKQGFRDIHEARKIIMMALEYKYGEPHSGNGADNMEVNSIWYGKKVDILYDQERGLFAYIYKPVEKQILKDREKENGLRTEDDSKSEQHKAEKAAKDL
jgi:hypothetical protein